MGSSLPYWAGVIEKGWLPGPVVEDAAESRQSPPHGAVGTPLPTDSKVEWLSKPSNLMSISVREHAVNLEMPHC